MASRTSGSEAGGRGFGGGGHSSSGNSSSSSSDSSVQNSPKLNIHHGRPNHYHRNVGKLSYSQVMQSNASAIHTHHHHNQPSKVSGSRNTSTNGQLRREPIPQQNNDDKPLSNTQLKKKLWREWKQQQHRDRMLGIDSRTAERRDHRFHPPNSSKALVTNASSNSAELTSAVAIDCEMVGSGPKGCHDMLARVSIVNTFGHVVYDTYVAPTGPVTDYRTFVSGIYPHHLENAPSIEQVKEKVKSILKNRILVGHALKNDLRVLGFTHPRETTRDTATYFSPEDYGGTGTAPSLKKLVEFFFKVKIQRGSHDSIEDARAAMKLYQLKRDDWESDIESKFGKFTIQDFTKN